MMLLVLLQHFLLLKLSVTILNIHKSEIYRIYDNILVKGVPVAYKRQGNG